jgi:hypothetical protein
MHISDDNLNLNRNININVDNNVEPNILSALLKYIDKIVETYTSPYILMCSGGVDSQVMLWAWKMSGHPYKVVHVTYDDYNKFDTDTLDEFTRQFEIPYEKINFDVINFLENDMDTYARKYRCGSPHICTYMAMTEMVPIGTKIFAGNLIYTTPTFPVDNTIFGLQRYANISGDSIIPFFLTYDDDVTSAAVKLYNANSERYLSMFSDHGIPGLHGLRIVGYQVKVLLYTDAGFPIISQNEKYTGFDEIKKYYDQFPERISFREKLKYTTYQSKRVFDQLFRYKYYREFNNDYIPKIQLVINN